MNKLAFDRISKSYGKTKALTDFLASLEPGIYALLGPNGSGKSTLMNILTDNLKADGGTTCFDRKWLPEFPEEIIVRDDYAGLCRFKVDIKNK